MVRTLPRSGILSVVSLALSSYSVGSPSQCLSMLFPLQLHLPKEERKEKLSQSQLQGQRLFSLTGTEKKGSLQRQGQRQGGEMAGQEPRKPEALWLPSSVLPSLLLQLLSSIPYFSGI